MPYSVVSAVAGGRPGDDPRANDGIRYRADWERNSRSRRDLQRGDAGLGTRRDAQLRRPRRPDRGYASHPRRGEALRSSAFNFPICSTRVSAIHGCGALATAAASSGSASGSRKPTNASTFVARTQKASSPLQRPTLEGLIAQVQDLTPDASRQDAVCHGFVARGQRGTHVQQKGEVDGVVVVVLEEVAALVGPDPLVQVRLFLPLLPQALMHRAPQPDRLGVTGGPWRQWHQNLFGLPQGLDLVRHLRLVRGECQLLNDVRIVRLHLL